MKGEARAPWTGEGIHSMVPVQLLELKEMDGQLEQIMLAIIIFAYPGLKSIPEITFIIVKSFIHLSKMICRHLYSFHIMQRYEFLFSVFLGGEHTLP